MVMEYEEAHKIDLKLTDAQLIEVLWQLTIGYKTLLEQVNLLMEGYTALIKHTDFLTEQLLKHRLVEFKKPPLRLVEVAEKMRELEEEITGLRLHYTENTLPTLKEIKESFDKSKAKRGKRY